MLIVLITEDSRGRNHSEEDDNAMLGNKIDDDVDDNCDEGGGAQKDVGRTDAQCRTIVRFVGPTKKVISSSMYCRGKQMKERGRKATSELG